MNSYSVVFYDLNFIALWMNNVCLLLNQMSVCYQICYFSSIDMSVIHILFILEPFVY